MGSDADEARAPRKGARREPPTPQGLRLPCLALPARAGVPRSRRIVLNNAGHLLYLELPDEFSKIVIALGVTSTGENAFSAPLPDTESSVACPRVRRLSGESTIK